MDHTTEYTKKRLQRPENRKPESQEGKKLMKRARPINRTGHCLEGFTLIETMVVIAIVGILAAVVVTSFTAVRTKVKVETVTRQFYTDLTEMRLKAMTENRLYGLKWTTAAYISSYDIGRYATPTAGNPIDSGAFTLSRTLTLDKALKEDPSTAVTALLFNEKGMAVLSSTYASGNYGGTAAFYSECKECDHVHDNCKPDDPADTVCEPADTSAGCSNPDYPDNSCIVVTMSRIRMGRWCDSDTNKTFTASECFSR